MQKTITGCHMGVEEKQSSFKKEFSLGGSASASSQGRCKGSAIPYSTPAVPPQRPQGLLF